jgi:transposase
MIGIDISKARLDVYGLEDGRRMAVGNDAAGIAALIDQLGLGARDLVVMEASGGYERLPQRLLSERGVRVAVVQCRAGARLRQGERPPGQNRPRRCRDDRALWRVCPAGADPLGQWRPPDPG